MQQPWLTFSGEVLPVQNWQPRFGVVGCVLGACWYLSRLPASHVDRCCGRAYSAAQPTCAVVKLAAASRALLGHLCIVVHLALLDNHSRVLFLWWGLQSERKVREPSRECHTEAPEQLSLYWCFGTPRTVGGLTPVAPSAHTCPPNWLSRLAVSKLGGARRVVPVLSVV